MNKLSPLAARLKIECHLFYKHVCCERILNKLTRNVNKMRFGRLDFHYIQPITSITNLTTTIVKIIFLFVLSMFNNSTKRADHIVLQLI